MAKLKADPITAADLLEFAKSQSDLQFEMEVKRTLFLYNFITEHGGAYVDPFTNKPRQFDIRAMRNGTAGRILKLAVECKNLRDNAPLMVSCVPRQENEAYQDLLVFGKTAQKSQAITWHIKKATYPQFEPVGKSLDQVGRLLDGSLSGGDRDLYEKWSQAITSAYDLADAAVRDSKFRPQGGEATAVIPCLVVPDGRLWRTTYDHKGEMAESPAPCDHVSLFVGFKYDLRVVATTYKFRISHLEIMTLSGLAKFADQFSRESEYWSVMFPDEAFGAIGH